MSPIRRASVQEGLQGRWLNCELRSRRGCVGSRRDGRILLVGPGPLRGVLSCDGSACGRGAHVRLDGEHLRQPTQRDPRRSRLLVARLPPASLSTPTPLDADSLAPLPSHEPAIRPRPAGRTAPLVKLLQQRIRMGRGDRYHRGLECIVIVAIEERAKQACELSHRLGFPEVGRCAREKGIHTRCRL
jgi:hypothetical protein